MCSRRRLFCLCYLCIEGRTRFDIGRLKTVYHRICARMNAATIFGSRVPRERIEHPWRDWREREREREEEREMKNNGGERYFYLKKKKKIPQRTRSSRLKPEENSLSRSLPARYSIMVDRCKDTQRCDNYIRAGQCPKKRKNEKEKKRGEKKRNCHLPRINNSRFAYGEGERTVPRPGPYTVAIGGRERRNGDRGNDVHWVNNRPEEEPSPPLLVEIPAQGIDFRVIKARARDEIEILRIFCFPPRRMERHRR